MVAMHVLLQWGRSISAAEITASDSATAATYHASMGPQHLSCGNGPVCTFGDW